MIGVDLAKGPDATAQRRIVAITYTCGHTARLAVRGEEREVANNVKCFERMKCPACRRDEVQRAK